MIPSLFRRLKNSIYRGSLNPQEEEDRYKLAIKSLILHLHPPTINKKTLKFSHTFGLGGMAIVLICLQFITGILLRFYYEPFPGRAYDSILHLQNNVLFGQLVRNLHHWSAVFLILITFLHLLRVFFTSAFHGKRQFNWVIGVILFLIVIFSNFTGYLLPWDQLSYWAVTVSTSMFEYIPLIGDSLKEFILGGSEIGTSTLLIFYNFHTGIFPILLIILMAFHFWRVRKAGGVVVPQTDEGNSFVTTIPNLVAKEFVVAILLISVIIILSILFNAPLLAKANPNVSPNPAKAPWYFMGIQELMLHFHPLFAAFIIPFTVLMFTIILPYFVYDNKGNGKWLYSEKAKTLIKNTVMLSIVITILFILADEYILKSLLILGFMPTVISEGVIPFLVMLILIYAYIKILKNRKANKNEIVQTIFVLFVTVFIVLTIVGIYFRGEGMELTIF